MNKTLALLLLGLALTSAFRGPDEPIEEEINYSAVGAHDKLHGSGNGKPPAAGRLQGHFVQTGETEQEKWNALCTDVKNRWTSNAGCSSTCPAGFNNAAAIDYTGTGGLASAAAAATWVSPEALKTGNGETSNFKLYDSSMASKISLFGSSGHAHPSDVNQGSVGDCYFLATLSSLAEYPSRVSKLISKCPSGQCYQCNFNVGGRTTRYTVNDEIPFRTYYTSGGKAVGAAYFAKIASDGAIWPALMEKCLAYAVGDYDITAGGNFGPVLRFLTGVPYDRFTISTESSTVIWSKIKNADSKKWPMACATGSGSNSQTNSLGLVMGHQYSVIGWFTVTIGGTSYELIKVRNPWGRCTFTGMLSPSASLWSGVSTTEKNRIGWSASDGSFFMTMGEFQTGFSVYSIAYYEDSYHYTDVEFSPNPNDQTACHKVTVQAGWKGYFGIDTVSDRMLGKHCVGTWNNLGVSVYDANYNQIANGQQNYIDNNFAFAEATSATSQTLTLISNVEQSSLINKAGINAYGSAAVTFTTCSVASELNNLVKNNPLYSWGAVSYGISSAAGMRNFKFVGAYSVYKSTVTVVITAAVTAGDSTMCSTQADGTTKCTCVVKGSSQSCSFWTKKTCGYSLSQSWSYQP